MFEKFGKKLETAANLAIVLAALAIVGVLGYKFFWSASENSKETAEVKTGENLNLPNVDWSQNKQTLVLAISKGCHLCAESAPFYDKIIKKLASSNDVKLMAIFPHSTKEAANYLKEHSLSIERVMQVDFTSARIRGTPTIFLIDERGTIKNAWLGKLSSDEEEEVLSKLL